jgi:hypothetical protein
MSTIFTAPDDTELPTFQFLIKIQRFKKMVGMINKNEIFETHNIEWVMKRYFNHWLLKFVDEEKSANYRGCLIIYEYLTNRHRKCKKEQSRRAINKGYLFKEYWNRIGIVWN